MSIKIRLAVRDWDYLTPLILGDVKSDKLELIVDRVNLLPDDLANDSRYDAAEISLSRYTLGCDKGQRPIIGVPHFIMRGFRHRCIITHKNSELTQVSQLAQKRIGLTGWQDSGNTWTRALLRREDIELDEIKWFVGRLTKDQPVFDRLGSFAEPDLIMPIADDKALMDMLNDGELDAVFTAFMPEGFFDKDSPFRQLIPDFRLAELSYFADVGYVPGIHILGIKPEIIQQHPWLAKELSQLLDQSTELWRQKRMKYAETTPWIIDDQRYVSQYLPDNWNSNSYEDNIQMLADFCYELYMQGLTTNQLTPATLFPECIIA